MTDISTTKALPLDDRRREMYEAVCANLNADRFRDLLVDLIGIHSPTGRERAASEFMRPTSVSGSGSMRDTSRSPNTPATRSARCRDRVEVAGCCSTPLSTRTSIPNRMSPGSENRCDPT